MIIPSGNTLEGSTAKMYWLAESTHNYLQQHSGKGGQKTEATQERREVQNALDIAREERIQHDLSVSRGETAPTEFMREIISRLGTMMRDKCSSIKPIMRQKYSEKVDKDVLDEIDQILQAACDDIAHLDLDDVLDLRSAIVD